MGDSYHSFTLTRNKITLIDNSVNQSTKYNAVLKSYDEIELFGNSVLDVGCSGGLYTFLPKQCGAKSTLGIDIQDFSIGGTTLYYPRIRRFLHRIPNVKFKIISFEDLEEKYDIVQLLGILHHLYFRSYKQSISDILAKVNSLTKKYALIEFIDTSGFGPYRDLPILSEETFLNTSLEYFLDIKFIEYTTNYAGTRKNRKLYLLTK